MRLSIQACMAMPANGAALEKRVRVLEERFCNTANARAVREIVVG